MYFFPFSYEDLQALMTVQNPDYAEKQVAVNKVRTGEQPTVEERKKCRTIKEAKFVFDSELNIGDDEEEWVYTPIPDELIAKSTGVAWVGPTPKCVEEVIEAITECWRYVRDLGEMPFHKEPSGLSDEECVEIIAELDRELVQQYSGWAASAGFERPPKFSELDLSVEDIRTIVAVIQEAVHRSGIKEKMN